MIWPKDFKEPINHPTLPGYKIYKPNFLSNRVVYVEMSRACKRERKYLIYTYNGVITCDNIENLNTKLSKLKEYL